MHSLTDLAERIKRWGQAAGFTRIRIGDTHLSASEEELAAWLDAGYHGGMDYMARHGMKRARPEELVPGTLRVISLAMPYAPETDPQMLQAKKQLADSSKAYVSRYALGRDYHKLIRNRLQKLAEQIAADTQHEYRVFTDSAPILEVALAAKSGIGWRGKHTLALNRQGSWFFLGEIFTTLPLPVDLPEDSHCGRCTRCLDSCPTGAIVAPYTVDARRCISYLTIENPGPIPLELRPLMGNRIYGCDDCQLVCPWNRHATGSAEVDFRPRHGLDHASLTALWQWSEADFRERMAGSPIYRIGYAAWQRNLAVASGNALRDEGLALPEKEALRAALTTVLNTCTEELVREHVLWALVSVFG